MTPIQFQQLLKNTKLDLQGKPEDLYELLNEFAELEYNNFAAKNSSKNAAQNLYDFDISSENQKEAA